MRCRPLNVCVPLLSLVLLASMMFSYPSTSILVAEEETACRASRHFLSLAPNLVGVL